MNKKANTNLDIIRVVAMVGVMLDHYFQSLGIPFFLNTGLFMGGYLLPCFLRFQHIFLELNGSIIIMRSLSHIIL